MQQQNLTHQQPQQQISGTTNYYQQLQQQNYQQSTAHCSGGARQYQHQQMTEANVPQSSHVRVASNGSNSQGTGSASYMVPAASYSVAQHHSSSSQPGGHPQQRMTLLKKGGSSHQVVSVTTASGSVKKQLSHGDISGFAGIKQRYSGNNSSSSTTGQTFKQSSTGQIVTATTASAVRQQQHHHHYSGHQNQHQQQANQHAGVGQQQAISTAQHSTTGHHHVRSGGMMNNGGSSKSPPAPQCLNQHQHMGGATGQQQISPLGMVQAHQPQTTAMATSNWPIQQKRASPPSGVEANIASSSGSQHYGSNSDSVTANAASLTSVGNIVKKQIKLNQPSNSSVQLGKAAQRTSTSPMNQLQAQIQSQQNKSMVFAAQSQVNTTVQQKIKFLLRGKEAGNVNEPTPSQRQQTTKLSKQKSPKMVYEIDNNTQATFGVDENIKENQQMNFQMGPQLQELAQESPSIGEEMTAAHPSLQPKIATSNLRGPLSFPKMSMKQPQPGGADMHAFPGLKNSEQQHQMQQYDGSMKIQTQEEEKFNPPNPTTTASSGLLHKKQLSQNLRYQVSGLTPSGHKPYSVSQLSAMVDAQNNAAVAKSSNRTGASNNKSPVHIHYHNHIQVINSSDLKGANITSTATPSKSPKQQAVQADSLQKPKISRQPSQTNIAGQKMVSARLMEQQVANGAISVNAKRISVKQSGAGNAPKLPTTSKFGPMSVTPRLTVQHAAQKSTPNLKTNLQVSTKPRLAGASPGVQNVSPAGKAALALLGQGARSTVDIGFADQLNAKLLDAQQKEEKSAAAVPGEEADLNTLTDSVDGSKVTSEALKKLQPIQSITPQKLQQVASKKQQTTSVPPLKLNQNQKEAVNLQVTAQVSASSSKPQNTGRVSHRLKQTRRGQNSSDQNVYKHNASQKSSVGQHSSKINQPILSSSGASSNSLTSLGRPAQAAAGGNSTNGASNKSANSILINELSKYINIRDKQHQKRFQQLAAQKQKKMNTSSKQQQRQPDQGTNEGCTQDQEEIMENLRHFLYFLERKKIVNITEVVQDKAKMNNLIQEIMKIDFKDFSKQSSQKLKKLRASSGSESNGSQNRAQTHARRRQGTPVNLGKQPQQSAAQQETSQLQDQVSQKGVTPRHPAPSHQVDPNHSYQPPYEPSSSAEHSNDFIQQPALASTNSQPASKTGPFQRARADSKNSSHNNLPIHDLNIQQQFAAGTSQQQIPASQTQAITYLAQKEANLHQQMSQQLQQQHPPQASQSIHQHHNHQQLFQQPSNMASNGSSTTMISATNDPQQQSIMTNTVQQQTIQAAQQQFQLTNQSSGAFTRMQMNLQPNYSRSSQYNTSNNYVSDSSGGQVIGTHQSHQKNQLGDHLMKFSNLGSTSRNKISHGVGVSAQGSSITKTGKGSKGQSSSSMATAVHPQRSSTNEQKAQGTNPPSSAHQPQNYANYKAVAVSQSEAGHKMHRKGNSADQGQDHSSKKSQFKISGLWDLAKHNQRGDSDTGNNGHTRRASEGQIVSRARGNDSSTSATRHQDHSAQAGHHNQREKRKRYKSRGGSADQGVQKEVLRLSRGSSAKRTAKEIVDYIVIDEDRFRVNDSIMRERERLIRYNKLYLKKYKQLPPTSLEFYEFVELIGKGAFGQVTLGIHKLTGRQVAIKAINKSYMQDTYSKQKVMQEVYILKKIRHSNIIRLFEVFQSPKHFLLVMEYANGGDLLQFVKKRQHLDEDTAQRIFKQVVHGIAHCHCRSVLHRDIKLDNILMDENEGIKICDFGVSRLITKNQSIQEQCGTPAYLAPEIIADKGYRGYYVDLWSLGVLLYAMLQGTVPFKAKSLEALHTLILSGKLDYPQAISEQARHLIQSMLKVEPGERISIPSILKHPWLCNEDELADEDCDDHDFEMGISFRREECNFNPLSMIGMSCNNAALASSRQPKQPQQQVNPEMAESESHAVDATEESNDEVLLTEQETNPMHQIGNINVLDVENLFHESKTATDGLNDGAAEAVSNNRLTYDNYCAVTQDFGTYHIDEEALKVLEGFGYPRKLVIDSLHSGELNHATTCYNLLVTQ